MQEPKIGPTYAAQDGTEFDTQEEWLAYTSNGWLAIVVLTNPKESWPWVTGPYATKREAENARTRLRSRLKKDQREHRLESNVTAKFFVRPAWKDL